MNVYTKNGDNGSSTLMNSTRISKGDIRFEVLGTVDELTSHLGLVKCVSLLPEQEQLTKIQRTLMKVMAEIADPGNRSYLLEESDIVFLETEIDRMEGLFPRIKEFVLPGGCEKSARLDVARTVARRAERSLVSMSKNYGIQKNSNRYLNRLSDYLYIFARYADYQEDQENKTNKTNKTNMDEMERLVEAEVRKALQNR